jgi:hypothetical protein
MREAGEEVRTVRASKDLQCNPKRETPMEIKDIERELTEAGQSQVCTWEELDLTLESCWEKWKRPSRRWREPLRGG